MESIHQPNKEETPLRQGPPAPVEVWPGCVVIGAPPWLRHQMELLRAQPPPTLEEVRIQFEASARISRALDSYEHVTGPIKRASVIR